MKHNSKIAAAWFLIIATAFVSVGCGPSPEQVQRFLAGSHTPVGCEEYIVMPPDKLVISATPTEEFRSLGVQIGPDGRCFLPLLGNYMLAGKSTTQIANELTENLLDFYEDVRVTVNVSSYRSQKFYVLGYVARPGPYPYTGNDSLFSALAAAGTSPLGWPERINVVRGVEALPGEDGTPVDQHGKLKNKTKRIVLNLTSMIEGDSPPINFMLATNDIIYVPPHPLARLGLAVQKLLFPITPMIQAAKSPYDLYDNATDTTSDE